MSKNTLIVLIGGIIVIAVGAFVLLGTNEAPLPKEEVTQQPAQQAPAQQKSSSSEEIINYIADDLAKEETVAAEEAVSSGAPSQADSVAGTVNGNF